MKFQLQEYLSKMTLNAQKIRIMSEKFDVTGTSALMYLEKYDAYQLMETSIINQVMESLTLGEPEKQGTFFQSSAFFKILRDQMNGVFRDQEELLIRNKSILTQLPHKYSFYVFMDSIMLRIIYDIIVYITFVVLFLWYIIEVAETISELFVVMYDNIPVGVAWDVFKEIYLTGTFDFNDELAIDALLKDLMSPNPSEMAAMMMPLMPKMEEMQWFMISLKGTFQTLNIFVVICCMHSFKTLMIWIYLKLTGRKSNLDFQVMVLDIGIVVWTIAFFGMFAYYSDSEKLDHIFYVFKVANYGDDWGVFALRMMFGNDSKTIRFNYFSALIAFLLMAKFIMQLQYTELFGPILKMIFKMTIEVLLFIIVWGIILLLFASTGQLFFYSIKDFSTSLSTMTYLTQAAMGAWDMSIFLQARSYTCDPWYDATNCYSVDKLEIDKNIGLIYMLCFLILNMIIIMNLVIAILATIYEEYSSFKRGLFYDTLIAALPKHKHDRYFGFMVTYPGIFAPLLILLAPVAWALKKVSPPVAYTFNMSLSLIAYLPVGFLATLFFVTVQLLSVPFVYVAVILSKMRMDRWLIKNRRKKPVNAPMTSSLWLFAFYAPFILALRFVIDLG